MAMTRVFLLVLGICHILDSNITTAKYFIAKSNTKAKGYLIESNENSKSYRSDGTDYQGNYKTRQQRDYQNQETQETTCFGCPTKLTCETETRFKSLCVFSSPENIIYLTYGRRLNYESGRIRSNTRRKGRKIICGINITQLEGKDIGTWRCGAFGKPLKTLTVSKPQKASSPASTTTTTTTTTTTAPAASTTPAATPAPDATRTSAATTAAVPSSAEEKFIQQIYEAHNKARRKHHAGPLKPNPLREKHAQAYADIIAKRGRFIRHGGHIEFGEGQNVATWTPLPTGKRVVEGWMGEEKNWNYGDPNLPPRGTGHFTQLVWKATREIGCGVATSENGKNWVVCNYYPKGNFGFKSSYIENVKKP